MSAAMFSTVQYNRERSEAVLKSRIAELEAAMIRVWWEFNQQHPDIRRIKELIAPNGPMPQPSR